jgi:glycosyltransferase involved in cell wall biosynthesis
MKRILFISHDATRTGAPILLLNLYDALKENYKIDFYIKNYGVIEDAFRQKDTNTFTGYLPRTRSRVINALTRRLPFVKEVRLKQIKWSGYDIVLSNTITNGDILPEVRKHFKGRIVSYIHELEMATSFFTSEKALQKVLNISDLFLVPSKAVQEHLIQNLSVSTGKICYLPYYIPSTDTHILSKSASNFLVAGLGTSDWRKSPDLFIIAAKLFFTSRPDANAVFVWQGAIKNTVEYDRLQYDVKQAGLTGRIIFNEPISNVNEFLASVHLLLLTSREDPYPLVVLEAANNQVPTVCFNKAGGSPDFVRESGGGCVVEYLNVTDFAAAITAYYDNRTQLLQDGEKASRHLALTHNSKDYIQRYFSIAMEQLN